MTSGILSLLMTRCATRTIDTILDRLKVLQTFPAAGQQRDDLYAGLRSWPIHMYVVFYTVTVEEIRIVRVLHGYRDVQAIFQNDTE